MYLWFTNVSVVYQLSQLFQQFWHVMQKNVQRVAVASLKEKFPGVTEALS